jgi:ASCH domain
MMLALSIKQPWAWLIVQGLKDTENRNWNTSYRGFFLIHAGKQVDGTFFANDGKTIYLPYAEQVCGALAAGLLPRQFEDYERGGIIGYATLKDVVTSSDSPWFHGPYGFVLTQRHTVPFIPLRGQIGLFDVPKEIEEEINAIRDERAIAEDAKDFTQIKREWREYRLGGDETPPWRKK